MPFVGAELRGWFSRRFHSLPTTLPAIDFSVIEQVYEIDRVVVRPIRVELEQVDHFAWQAALVVVLRWLLT